MKLSLEWGKVRKYSELSQKDEFFLISNILCPEQQMLFSAKQNSNISN